MKTRLMRMSLIALGVALPLATPAKAQDHPFTLVNVIDLFEFFSLSEPVDPNFSPTTGPPPNLAAYQADPRLGTNPVSVVVDGDRMWVAGFYNGANFGSSDQASREGWYASLGVGEVSDIYNTSGFDGSLNKYDGSFHFGPGIRNTDNFTGLDYDPVSRIVYVAFDDTQDVFSLPSGADPQQGSFIGALDADPNSPNYEQYLWQLADPINPVSSPFDAGDRFFGGVAVDPFNPQWVYVAQNGFPVGQFNGFRVIDTTDPNAFDPCDPSTVVNVKDANAPCTASFYRQMSFDAVTGDMFVRNANAAERIPRDDNAARFVPATRFIREPNGGNGTADTVASGDDEQLINLAASVSPGDRIIGAGPNGVIDTVPAGDDERSPIALVNERPIGNRNTASDDGDCDEDPVNGYPNGPFGQGQGVAVVSASNLAGLTDDLVIGNNRPTFGANQLTDLRFFDLAGSEIADLELPCSPVPGAGTGLGIYDVDYDEATGTLVVLEFEQRKAYVFRAQLDGGSVIPGFDFTRNGATDMQDFVLGFQRSFTGSENTEGLSLNAQRLNADSDCDIDFLDFESLIAVWDSIGGP